MEQARSEYPTDAEIKEMWDALETEDDQEILAVLWRRDQEREEADKAEQVKDRLGVCRA